MLSSDIDSNYPPACNDREIAAALDSIHQTVSLEGKSVVVLVPDGTRTAPMTRLASLVEDALGQFAVSITWLVALGTHQPMSQSALQDHLGRRQGEVLNHEWWKDETFATLGELSATTMSDLSGGRLSQPVAVRLNRRVVQADVSLVLGPVFPHEVVGYSGGNKYYFPGVAGQEVIDATHWLGALHTSRALIGSSGVTPVRAVIDAAAAMIPRTRAALSVVVAPSGDVVGAFAGTPEESWQLASELSSRVHVKYLASPVTKVVAVLGPKYEDMWTGAKGMYKAEPVVADGGEVVIYAPHITEFSRTHGAQLAEIGYHVRDYFLGQWESFGSYPGGVLAHSTHLRGDGRWSAPDGEQARITVTLATGIPATTCRSHGLAYADPASINLGALSQDPAVLVIENAGEMLYLLSSDARVTRAATSSESSAS